MEMACLEDLLERHQLLINDVKIRQNPNNIIEWLNRIEILKEKMYNHETELCFVNALDTINVEISIGDPSQIWIEYSKFVSTIQNDVKKAISIYKKATDSYRFIKVDHLANVWCSYVEFLIDKEYFIAKDKDVLYFFQ